MPRTARNAPGGMIFHCLNRAVARLPLFEKEDDYAAFERVLCEAQEKHPTRIVCYCLMPNHWHFLLWPREDGELTAFLRWLTHTHTMRWHAHHKTSGTGHLYQGRFKSFPVEKNEYFYNVARYVEQNTLRAGLTNRADQWRWSSVWRRQHGDAEAMDLLSDWPCPRPSNWLAMVNRRQKKSDLDSIRRSVCRGNPYGSERWVTQSAVRLGLEHTLRSIGRPKKTPR
jgi:putative transposase